MSVLVSTSESRADDKNKSIKQKGLEKALEFSSYCNKCEFSNWCDKINKPFMLQSTIEANELYNELEDSSNIDLDELPYKIYQLKKILQRTLQNIK